MGLFGALYAGISGLSAFSQALASISDNVANANTIGYKRIETRFENLVTQSSASLHSPGGVRSRPIYQNNVQGLLQSTGQNTDLALSGEGFFITSGNTTLAAGEQFSFTRAGSFFKDASGFLRNTAGFYLRGWELVDGVLPTNLSSLSATKAINVAQVTGVAKETEKVELGANVPSKSAVSTLPTFTGASTQSTDVQVIDSLGSSHTVRMLWQHAASSPNNVWRLSATVTDGAFGGTATIPDFSPADENFYELEFNTDGSIKEIRTYVGGSATPVATANTVGDSADITMRFDFSGVGAGAAQDVVFDLGTIGSSDGITSYDADYFTAYIKQDGKRYGTLKDINIDAEGKVIAILSNGETLALYQIPIARFANINGLELRSGNIFTQTAEAGELILGAANTGGSAKVIAGSLEQSTSDIATEFTNMIPVQRAYAANAKIISTANEMLQTVERILS